MTLPVFPTKPVDPVVGGTLALPLWCETGSKQNPLTNGRPNIQNTGWINVTGQTYGEIPPYQWVNWESYAVGQWSQYFDNVGDYIVAAQNAGLYTTRSLFINSIDPPSQSVPPGGSITFDYVGKNNSPFSTSSLWDGTVFTAPTSSNYTFSGFIQANSVVLSTTSDIRVDLQVKSGGIWNTYSVIIYIYTNLTQTINQTINFSCSLSLYYGEQVKLINGTVLGNNLNIDELSRLFISWNTYNGF